MSWDVVAADERIRWTLEPLHRVGPLWFGMTAEEAEQALDGELVPDPWGRVRPHNGSVVSREFNLPHVPTLAAVTAYFGTGRLVGAAFDARRGPPGPSGRPAAGGPRAVRAGGRPHRVRRHPRRLPGAQPPGGPRLGGTRAVQQHPEGR